MVIRTIYVKRTTVDKIKNKRPFPFEDGLLFYLMIISNYFMAISRYFFQHFDELPQGASPYLA